jgi:hypothetical protein
MSPQWERGPLNSLSDWTGCKWILPSGTKTAENRPIKRLPGGNGALPGGNRPAAQ